jgi:hypothetical protein
MNAVLKILVGNLVFAALAGGWWLYAQPDNTMATAGCIAIVLSLVAGVMMGGMMFGARGGIRSATRRGRRAASRPVFDTAQFDQIQ